MRVVFRDGRPRIAYIFRDISLIDLQFDDYLVNKNVVTRCLHKLNIWIDSTSKKNSLQAPRLYNLSTLKANPNYFISLGWQILLKI